MRPRSPVSLSRRRLLLGALFAAGCAIENPAFDPSTGGDDDALGEDDASTASTAGLSSGSEGPADDDAGDATETAGTSAEFDSGDDADATGDSSAASDGGDGDVTGDSSDASDGGDGDGDGDANICPLESECRRVPDGWSGFFAYAQAPPDDVLTCADTTHYPTPAAAPFEIGPLFAHDCSPCGDCLIDQAPGLIACDGPFPVEIYGSMSTCTNALDPLVAGEISPGCADFPAPTIDGSFVGLFPDIGPTTPALDWICEDGKVIDQTLEFQEAGHLCALDQDTGIVGTCELDQQPADCIVRPPNSGGDSGFQGGICIKTEGLVGCPAGYPDAFYRYDHVDDRGCSTCTCNDPTGGNCALRVEVFDNATCGGEAFSVGFSNDPACTEMAYNQGTTPDASAGLSLSVEVLAINATGALCEAEGAVPVGGVTSTKTMTVCCDIP